MTAVDPGARLYGPALFGWPAYLDLKGAPDSAAENQTYGTFADYYLAGMKTASAAAGRRLLHRFDMHWYSEAQGDHRIVMVQTTPSYGSEADITARLQAPRSLGDAAYVEKSWITRFSTEGKPLRLLARLRESVARRYPGTGLAITEYNYGGAENIAGGVAQADVLGILGEAQVDGCFWSISEDNRYIAAAFQLYRNYDGHGAHFGSISLAATCSGDARAAIHAARTNPRQITLVAINRSPSEPLSAEIRVHLPAGESLQSV